MEEERPSEKAYTPITPPEDEPTATEAEIVKQPAESESSRNLTGMIAVGFLIVIALIIVGLFLPPISLGERLGLTGGDETAAETVDEGPMSSEGGGSTTATVAEDGPSNLSFAQFSDSSEWSDAAAAIPADWTTMSDVYFNRSAQGASGAQIAVALSADSAAAETLDLYGWNGEAWQFVPSLVDASGRALVTRETTAAQALVAMQVGDHADPLVGAELLPTQSLPSELLPLLTEISAGTLTLAGDGSLAGEPVPVPDGSYGKLLRATNTGAIIDQVSLSQFLNDESAQTNQINMLVGSVLSGGYAGINLDYQGVEAEQSSAFSSFVNGLAEALHNQDRTLAITLATPKKDNGNFLSAGQDWSALGQTADVVHVQMPLDPVGFADGGAAEQLLLWATRQIPRQKISMLLSASAIDRIGESFLEMPNDQALVNFGELQFVQGSAEVEPGTPIEVTLSGSATPLEWDGASLTYKYTYELSGQTHHVWIGSEAALSHQLRIAKRHRLGGVAVRGLGQVADGAGYAAAFASYLDGSTPPQPAGAAIVWTVRSDEGSVVASSSGDTLSYAWDGTEDPGSYHVKADFALGENVAALGSLEVAVIAPEAVEEVVEVATEEAAETAEPEATATPEPAAEATPPPVLTPGEADAVVNVGSNVRVGPGLTYGTIAGGLNSGDKVSILGRNSDASWFNILFPDGATEGWIFATLININSAIDVNALEVITVDPPVVADDGGGSPSPPPVTVPPVTNTGFELGGQTHTLANPTLMSYAGMNWVKFQHKWSPGDSPDAVAGRIQQAQANGFKVLLSIPGSSHGSIDFNAYASFLGGVAALGPNAIEIWNEMNIDREWPAGQISPVTYVNSMLAPAYNAIKASNPNVMVVSGAPAPTGFFGGCGGAGCNDDLYVAGMAGAGAANYMDCIGIHYNEGIISPHQTSGDPRNPSNHYTRYFWGMVNAYWNAFGGSRPLCFTELGYLSGADYGGVPGGFSWAGNTSVAQHAQWLAEATSLAASSGKVRLLIVFNVDFTLYGEDPQAGYGMVRADGSCPACETLRQVMGGG